MALGSARFMVLSILALACFVVPLQSGFTQTNDDPVELLPTDDAYVIRDMADASDKLGLRSINTGKLDFLKVWYAWNVTEAENMRLLSIAYMKFDLSEIKQSSVGSAKLVLYAQNVSSTRNSIAIDLHEGLTSPWQESSITSLSAPDFRESPIATAAISGDGQYEWDITRAVNGNAGSQITILAMPKTMMTNAEEQVVFTSKETSILTQRPRLVVDFTSVIDNTKSGIDASSGWLPLVGAIIAAAAVFFAFVIYWKKNKHVKTVTSASASGQSSSEAENHLSCPNCSAAISRSFNVCPYCEHDLKETLKCAKCQREVSKDYKHCPYCGVNFGD